MKSNFLLGGAMPRRLEFMSMASAPPAAGDDASQAGGGNNTAPAGGNSDTGASNAGDSNNASDNFDPASFWTEPEQGRGGAPAGESVATSTPAPAPAPTGDFATQLTTQLENMSFGEPIMSDAMAKDINEGNFEGFNKAITSQMQAAVRHALGLQVQILKPAFERLIEQVREEQASTFTNRDNQDSLVTLFPAAKNPVMARTIQPIYDQALKRTSGNREEAVKQTKEMLRFMAGEAAGDLGLEVAPQGAGDYRPAAPNLNWLDELTGRN